MKIVNFMLTDRTTDGLILKTETLKEIAVLLRNAV